MKREFFLMDSIGEIDSSYIVNANMYKKQGLSKILRYVACILLAASVTLVSFFVFQNTKGNEQGYILSATAFEDFFYATDSTQLYIEKRVEKGESLNLIKPLECETLPIFEIEEPALSEADFSAFIEKYIPAIEDFANISTGDFVIEKETLLYRNYEASLYERGKWSVRFWSGNNYNAFSYIPVGSYAEINGEKVAFDWEYSDQQIKETLAPTIEYLEKILGVKYDNFEIEAKKEGQSGRYITLYNNKSDMILKDHINKELRENILNLYFEIDEENNVGYLWSISYYDSISEWKDYYKLLGNAKMLTLKEAEEMLYKGYVFGGHFCEYCMQSQKAVDFTGYEEVGFEYIVGKNGMCVPFYSFYKLLYEGKNGKTYAKTYVPAIEIDGIAEYFASQKTFHESYY